MNIEKINEPVRVLADCVGGRMEPLRFQWGSRTYKVESVNGRWIDRQVEGYCLHYSVQVGQETYFLHFASKEVLWRLDEVIVM